LVIAKGSHASAWNKMSAAFYTFGKLSLPHNWMFIALASPLNLPVSKWYAPAA